MVLLFVLVFDAKISKIFLHPIKNQIKIKKIYKRKINIQKSWGTKFKTMISTCNVKHAGISDLPADWVIFQIICP
jgi:hypothetical protein